MSADSTTPKDDVVVKQEEAKTEAKASDAKTTSKAKKTTGTTAKKKPAEKPAAAKVEAKPAKEETKAPAKKPAAKKTELKPELFLEYQGSAVSQDDLLDKVKADWTAGGHSMSNVKSLKIYIKPEDNKAYYVINDKYSGDVDMF